MYVADPGWLRPLLALVLVLLGVILRFAISSRIGGFGLRRFRTHPDEDLAVKVRERVGEMLLVWAGWLVLQMVAGVPESWVTAVWAPLLIIIAIAPSYTARLYAQRYFSERSSSGGAPRVVRAGWLWVILRELVPLAAILFAILIVRKYYEFIPSHIPVGWDLETRAYEMKSRDVALDILRHRTMAVYLVLFSLEGIYLLVRWVRDKRGDIATRMLTRPHWLFYLFRVSWVLLFAGLNLGFVYHGWGEGSLLSFLLPGLFTLSSWAILVVLGLLRSNPTPGLGSPGSGPNH